MDPWFQNIGGNMDPWRGENMKPEEGGNMGHHPLKDVRLHYCIELSFWYSISSMVLPVHKSI